MTDLLDVLPAFPIEKHSHLVSVLEARLVTTSDLLTADVVDLARRVQLPILDLKHLITQVKALLHQLYELPEEAPDQNQSKSGLIQNGSDLVAPRPLISSLDDSVDSALGGGIATGYLTEVTGESGAGKTQFLLTLLLSVQLPAPQGLDRGAIYISTEHVLPTSRLQSILASHPKLKDHESPPLFKRILSIQIPDLEAQDHILAYQLPVAVKSQNVGLVVIDSITANYRAELETSNSESAEKSRVKALAGRSIELVRIGALLRKIAAENDCAIIVANQVSDRFEQQTGPRWPMAAQTSFVAQEQGTASSRPVGTPNKNTIGLEIPESSQPQSSPMPMSLPSSSTSSAPRRPTMNYDRPSSPTLLEPRLTLDHQMRFFTGWGDNEQHNLKTPALGLTWTNQVACRIAIIRESTFMGVSNAAADVISDRGQELSLPLPESGLGGADWSRRRWRRWIRVVFAAWVQENEGKGAEFEIWSGGIRSVEKP